MRRASDPHPTFVFKCQQHTQKQKREMFGKLPSVCFSSLTFVEIVRCSHLGGVFFLMSTVVEQCAHMCVCARMYACACVFALECTICILNVSDSTFKQHHSKLPVQPCISQYSLLVQYCHSLPPSPHGMITGALFFIVSQVVILKMS